MSVLLESALRDLVRPGEQTLVRIVEQVRRDDRVVRGVVEPLARQRDLGAMVSVRIDGGSGYCASQDLSPGGLAKARERALDWALASREQGLFAGLAWPRPASPLPPERARLGWDGLAAVLGAAGSLSATEAIPPSGGTAVGDDERFGDARLGRAALVALLREEAARCRSDERIVNWVASIVVIRERQWLWADGALIDDRDQMLVSPNLEVTASDGGRSQTRSLGGQYNGFCQQGGYDVIAHSGLIGAGPRLAEEAIELLLAPNCPSGRMSVLLAPDQMMLQIHESIGHPLELDRILGDERNFAGTSFVTPDMFGHYQYGSECLNVCFEPDQAEGFASYAKDDDGTPAQTTWLIREGRLLRPLGSALSIARLGQTGVELEGVANARASAWHRPPIDRMANLNVAAGDSSLDQMIAAVENGVWMKTNVSWSIDDSRNKFQFGCEWGRLIQNGRLGPVVRNPNYRGVSATFWRNLRQVGDVSTYAVMGTPFCGKGEPGQVIRVGHSAPACLFADVDVFGAAS